MEKEIKHVLTTYSALTIQELKDKKQSTIAILSRCNDELEITIHLREKMMKDVSNYTNREFDLIFAEADRLSMENLKLQMIVLNSDRAIQIKSNEVKSNEEGK